MKILLIFLIASFSFSLSLKAQKIFTVDANYKADIKVFVVDAEYKADLVVFKEKADYQAKGNEGLWFFVDAAYKADKKIYFVDAEYKSELKIFFCDAEYKAKWRNPGHFRSALRGKRQQAAFQPDQSDQIRPFRRHPEAERYVRRHVGDSLRGRGRRAGHPLPQAW